jgi:hypothetical protein
MNQPTVFDRNTRLSRPAGRAGWNASFEPVLADLRRALLARQPEHLALLAGAEWDPAASELRLSWLGTEYCITWPELAVFARGAQEPCPASVQGLFLYHLSLADGSPPAGTWVSFRELPDGWLYHQAFQGYTGALLVRTLGDDMAALVRAAELAGGTVMEAGDCGYAFQVLPRVRLAVVYWRGDEEFPAETTVLFDAAAAHYLPIDGLAFLGSHLVQHLLRLAV